MGCGVGWSLWLVTGDDGDVLVRISGKDHLHQGPGFVHGQLLLHFVSLSRIVAVCEKRLLAGVANATALFEAEFTLVGALRQGRRLAICQSYRPCNTVPSPSGPVMEV